MLGRFQITAYIIIDLNQLDLLFYQ